MKRTPAYQNIHQKLIDDCLRGSSRAQFKLYKLYYKAMFNTCMRIVNDPIEAEDIMQEAFLSAFTRLPDYKGEVSFGSWLKKIVVNRSIDFLRARKVLFETLPVDLPDDKGIEEEGAVSVIRPEMVYREINTLPDGYRIVLSLYLIEGYDHEEIAGILNITQSTSRSQYARAKQKLMLNLKNKYLK